MDVRNHWLTKIVFAIFLSLTVSQVYAKDDVTIISADAGDDQFVNAGDKVHLRGVVEYIKNKKNAKNKNSNKSHYNKKSFKNNDDVVINWTQDTGTTVDLRKSDRLKSKFYAPTPATPGEVLTFTLTVSDGDGAVIASDSVNVTVQSPSATITGRVTTPDGTELSNIAIDIQSSGTSLTSTTSDVNGVFSVDLSPNTELLLALSAAGYADQVVPIKTPSTQGGSLFLDITMLMRGVTQTFDADTDASLSGEDGASVSIPAGSFVDENGSPVTGNIDLTITPVDISRSATLAAFPGEFSGILEGATEDSPIVSFGAVEYEFSQSGQPVQLVTGQTADILIPIYIATYQDGSLIALGDTIPLWSLNEGSGLWEQEGNGTVVASAASPTGLAMDANVGHFSWWNCDVTMSAAQAIVTVFAPNPGDVIIRASTAVDIGWRPGTVDTVSRVGIATPPLFIPSTGEVCFWADITYDGGLGSATTSPLQCITAAPNSLVNVDLVHEPGTTPLNIFTIPETASGITGYIGFPIDRVQLLPSTIETSVTYANVIGGTGDGALPDGLLLDPVSGTTTRAEITGTPTVPDIFDVRIDGTDSDGNTDTVLITYTITTDVPPPQLPEHISINYEPNVPIDMNIYTPGSTVTNWSLSYNPDWEQSPPPAEIILDPVSGILTVTQPCIYWYGILNASNGSGTSDTSINIVDSSCYGEE